MKIFEQLDRRRDWSEEERILIRQVQRVADAILAPNAAAYDRNSEFPWDNIHALNELGLNAIFVPEEYGGSPMRFLLYLELVSIISEACASTAIIYATTFHALKGLIDVAGANRLKARLLPRIAEGALASLAITEPSAGSDATGMKTRFTPDGDDIVVDGGKCFITSGDVADYIFLFGKWSEIAGDRESITALLLDTDTPGFEVVRKEDKLGTRASSTVTLAFNGCRVPRANLVGEPGDGLRVLHSTLNKSRPSIAAHARGIARAAFKDMVAYMNEREQSRHKIIDFQGNQFMLADLASELAMVENWIDYVAGLFEAGVEDVALEASIAKMRASDLAMRMATDAVQMHGGSGYCKDFRVERLMRDAKITQIWEGTNQVHRQLIGRSFKIK